MTSYPSQDTFVRGEISPRLHARASLDLYKAGLSKCENFLTLPHGGLRKRGGTYYVDDVPGAPATRLIPFVFSNDQAYVLVVTDFLIRVYAYGARVGTVEIVTPYPAYEIWDIQFTQAADVMWLTHPNHKLATLTRTAHTTWTLADFDFTDGPFGVVNTNDAIYLTISGISGTITIGSIGGAPFTSDMIQALIRIDMLSYESIQPWEPNTQIDSPTIDKRVRYEGNIYQTPNNYNTAGYNAKTGATPPTHTEGTEWDGTYSLETLTNVTSGYTHTYHAFQWTFLNPGYGTARILSVDGPTQVTAQVLVEFPSELVSTSNKWRIMPFRAGGGGPNGVTIFEERLMLAHRYSLFGSKTGDFEHFETGEKADDGLSFTQAGGGEANDIAWLREVDGFLAIGTIGGVRSMAGAGIDEPLTPTSFKNRSSHTTACAPIAPTSAGKSTVYIGKGRKVLVELTVTQQLRFQSEDLGQISEHIPKLGLIEVAFQNFPDPFIWFPLDDGQLGSFTYQPSQDVRGMHRQRLGGSGSNAWGAVESCVVTPGQNGQDDVWLLVRRTINGTTRLYIEIITPTFENGEVEDAFQVDCGLSYSGAAVGTVTGMSHLIAETVDVLADGRVYRGITVSGAGTVTLPDASTATKWQVGLPFESGADTLELDVGGRDGSLKGRRKRITKVILSLFETDLTGLQISSLQRERWESVKLPTIAAATDEVVLFSGNVEVPIDDSWEGQARIRIRHSNPTPCTIRAATPAFDNEP